MNDQLCSYLYKKYPKILTSNLPIDCSDGWFFLLNCFLEGVQSHIDLERAYVTDKDPIPQVVALQVKEKFGGLRFYFTGGDSNIRVLAQFVEHLSHYICEESGDFSEKVGIVTKGWIKTLTSEQASSKNWQSAYDEELLQIFEKLRST